MPWSRNSLSPLTLRSGLTRYSLDGGSVSEVASAAAGLPSACSASLQGTSATGVCGLLLELGHERGVRVRGERVRGVPEEGLDGLHGEAGSQAQGGRARSRGGPSVEPRARRGPPRPTGNACRFASDRGQRRRPPRSRPLHYAPSPETKVSRSKAAGKSESAAAAVEQSMQPGPVGVDQIPSTSRTRIAPVTSAGATPCVTATFSATLLMSVGGTPTHGGAYV